MRDQATERQTTVTRLETQLREERASRSVLQTEHNLLGAKLDSTQKAFKSEVTRLKAQVKELESSNDELKSKTTTLDANLGALTQARERLEQQLRKRPTSEQLEEEQAKRIKLESDLKRVSGQFDLKQVTVQQLQSQLASQSTSFKEQAEKAQEQWTSKLDKLKQAGQQLREERDLAHRQLEAIQAFVEPSYFEEETTAQGLLRAFLTYFGQTSENIPKEFHHDEIEPQPPLFTEAFKVVWQALQDWHHNWQTLQGQVEEHQGCEHRINSLEDQLALQKAGFKQAGEEALAPWVNAARTLLGQDNVWPEELVRRVQALAASRDSWVKQYNSASESNAELLVKASQYDQALLRWEQIAQILGAGNQLDLFVYIQRLQKQASLDRWRQVLEKFGVVPQANPSKLVEQYEWLIDGFFALEPAFQDVKRRLEECLQHKAHLESQQRPSTPPQVVPQQAATGTMATHPYLDLMDQAALQSMYDSHVAAGRPTSHLPTGNADELRAAIRAMLDRAPSPPPPSCTHADELRQDLGAPVGQAWSVSISTIHAVLVGLGEVPGVTIDEVAGDDTHCNHIVALASKLARPPTFTWNQLRQEVRNLLVRRNLGGGLVPGPAGGAPGAINVNIPEKAREWKPEDVPEFKDGMDYWEWRGPITRLNELRPPSDRKIRESLGSVTSRFTGARNSGFIISLGERLVTDCVRDTWQESWATFLAKADSTFLPLNTFDEAEDTWEKFSARGFTDGQQFMVAFQKTLWTRDNRATLELVPRLTQDQIRLKMRSALPTYIKEWMDLHHPRWFVSMAFDEYRTIIINAWKRLPRVTHAGAKRLRWESDEDSSDDEPTARMLKRARTGGKQCPFRYNKQELPEKFQGKLRLDSGGVNRNLLRALGEANRCTTCRGTRAFHQQGNHAFNDAASFPKEVGVRWADIKEEENTPELSAAPIKSEENN